MFIKNSVFPNYCRSGLRSLYLTKFPPAVRVGCHVFFCFFSVSRTKSSTSTEKKSNSR